MEMLTLVLLFTIAVLISAVIDQIVPKISLPLIQVLLGVLIAFFAEGVIEVDLEPDLFLVLFIAPLLYIEAKSADKAILWKNIKPILSLSIGLVVVTTFIIGVILHSVVPAISLAAAFALGAALGPTDAVAVTSLSKQVTIPERQWGILKGELLLNDASGIVSFQFAIAAAATGTFSLFNAGTDFLVEFLGGLIVGALFGYVANKILRKIRDIGIESTTFHVLYELCIPFLVYLLSDAIHVSGIIAVVVAGLVNVIAPRTVSPAIAQMNIVSNNVWSVLSFALNGFVFVLLGTQLPTAMLYSWEDRTISNATLIMLIILVTVVLMGVRFIWCFLMELYHKKRVVHGKYSMTDLKDSLLLTFCGAKGTITLSILFTIPIFMVTTGARFPGRNLLLFIGCGVILCTLLLATFLVPMIAPKRTHKQTDIEARQNYYECLAEILRNVIEELTLQQTQNNRRSTKNVIKAYQDRLTNIKDSIDIEDELNSELRVKTIEWEQERTLELMDEGTISFDMGYSFLIRLEKMKDLVKHSKDRMTFRRMLHRLRLVLIELRNRILRILPNHKTFDRFFELRQLQIETATYVIRILRESISNPLIPSEDTSKLLLFYENLLSRLRSSNRDLATTIKIVDETDDIKRLAYQIELEQIQKMYEDDRISRHEAKNMRDNVFLMQMDLDDKF